MRRDRRQAPSNEEQEQEEQEGQESTASTSVRGGALPPVLGAFASSSSASASQRAYGESEGSELESHEATHVVQQRRS